MTIRMPVLFMGHGSPMNAIEDNPFSREWAVIASGIPKPKVIVCVSAHWETRGTRVTAMPNPRTIHDFGGFPQELFDMLYPAPGDPDMALHIVEHMDENIVSLDRDWGLDHGTWSVLARMYPQADIPVVQLSLNRGLTYKEHYLLGQRLRFLRDEGVLIIGSGNIVHNLRMISFSAQPFDWAVEVDEQVKAWILSGQHNRILEYNRLSRAAQLAINSGEHFLPLLYVLGAQSEGEPVSFYNESLFAGSLSMRCVRIG